MTDPFPISPRMSYGQIRMALYQVAPDLHVASTRLPGKLDGIYCLTTNTVLIDRRITYTRKRCALVHELVHWQHGDDTTHGCIGGKNERRCRHETARLLINPAEYALAERMYDGNPYQMAAELNVTVQVIEDYKNWLHDSVAAWKKEENNDRANPHAGTAAAGDAG